jgi:hypothetical protein
MAPAILMHVDRFVFQTQPEMPLIWRLASFGTATFEGSGAGGSRQVPPTTPSYAHMAMATAKHVPVCTAVDMAKKMRAA